MNTVHNQTRPTRKIKEEVSNTPWTLTSRIHEGNAKLNVYLKSFISGLGIGLGIGLGLGLYHLDSKSSIIRL